MECLEMKDKKNSDGIGWLGFTHAMSEVFRGIVQLIPVSGEEGRDSMTASGRQSDYGFRCWGKWFQEQALLINRIDLRSTERSVNQPNPHDFSQSFFAALGLH